MKIILKICGWLMGLIIWLIIIVGLAKEVIIDVVCAISSIYFFPKHIYNIILANISLSINSGAFFALFVINIFVAKLFIYHSKFFLLKIIIRITSLFFLLISLLLLLYCFVPYYIRNFKCLWNSYCGFSNLYKIFTKDGLVSYLDLSTVIILGYIVVAIIWKIYKDLKLVHFMTPRRKNIILYLRNFKFDNKDEAILEKLNEIAQKFKLYFLKIGNPSIWGVFGNNCNVYYLPTTNWQTHLNEQINNAKYIFSVVDISEGVFWEIFHHTNQTKNFIYYIWSYDILEKLIQSTTFLELIQNKNIVALALNEIHKKEVFKESIFTIENNKCLYVTSKKTSVITWTKDFLRKKEVKNFEFEYKSFLIDTQ